jgi:hypothetical protein
MKKNSWLTKPKPRPKILQYEAFGIAFLVHFHNVLELNTKMQQQWFHWLRNAKQQNICSLTKVNGIHETKQEKNYETKQNLTSDETKRNETKFCCFYCFAKQAKFRETNVLFRFVSCFAKQKKGCEMETLILYNCSVLVYLLCEENKDYLFINPWFWKLKWAKPWRWLFNVLIIDYHCTVFFSHK